ncbi:dienelactone hydrolase family protein [Streptomyces olivoreticuli]
MAAGPHAVLDRAASVDAPVMLRVGAEDHVVPADQVRATGTALRAAGVGFVQHVCENAGHAFAGGHCSRAYRPGPAETAWQRTWAFLDRHIPTPA